MVRIEDLPASAFPDKPLASGLCLECGKVERCVFSWFCGDECEEAYIKKYNAAGFRKGIFDLPISLEVGGLNFEIPKEGSL
jgi:hypothetical protein